MNLSDEQKREILKNPQQKQTINDGLEYEGSLQFVADPLRRKEIEKNKEFTPFFDRMRNKIGEQKTERIKSFCNYPLSVVSLSNSMLKDLYKVFNAGNSFFDVNTVKGKGEKFKERLEKLNLTKWVEKEGKKVLRSRPNSILFIDRDEEGEPKLLTVGNDRLIDFQLRDNNFELEYLVFIHSKKKNEKGVEEVRVAVVDDDSVTVYVQKDGDYSQETIIKHGFSKVPARFFISEKMNEENDLNRIAPLSVVMSKLLEWQEFYLYKYYTDHYQPFPVTEQMRATCGLSSCHDGIITRHQTVTGTDGVTEERSYQETCEACKEANSIQIGSKLLIDPKDSKDDDTASGKFRMISNDVKNLEYLRDKLKDIKEELVSEVCGVNDLISRESVNEEQVQGAFESSTNVLLKLKTDFEDLIKWIVLRVSEFDSKKDGILSVSFSMGTEFYLVGEADLQKKLKEAIDNNYPEGETNQIYFSLIDTKYKGNNELIKRMRRIHLVDPLPFRTIQEKIDLLNNGIITREEFILSENMSSLMQEFEENQNITIFGDELTEAQAVVKLREALLLIIKKRQDEQSKGEQGGGSD